jgi:hypothetical protein
MLFTILGSTSVQATTTFNLRFRNERDRIRLADMLDEHLKLR